MNRRQYMKPTALGKGQNAGGCGSCGGGRFWGGVLRRRAVSSR